MPSELGDVIIPDRKLQEPRIWPTVDSRAHLSIWKLLLKCACPIIASVHWHHDSFLPRVDSALSSSASLVLVPVKHLNGQKTMNAAHSSQDAGFRKTLVGSISGMRLPTGKHGLHAKSSALSTSDPSSPVHSKKRSSKFSKLTPAIIPMQMFTCIPSWSTTSGLHTSPSRLHPLEISWRLILRLAALLRFPNCQCSASSTSTYAHRHAQRSCEGFVDCCHH